MVQPTHRPTLSGRGGTLSAGRGRAVVVHSGRGAAGVQITLSERFEGNSRASTSAPHSAGRAPARDVSRSAGGGRGRAGRPLAVASSRGRVRGAIRKSAAAPTVRGGRRAGVAPTVVRGGRPAAKVAPTVIRGGRKASGVSPGRVTGVAPGRVSARAAGRGARTAGAKRNVGRNAGRTAGRGRGRDESRDEFLTLADMDADMDAWRSERAAQQEKVAQALAPADGVTAEGDAAGIAADTVDGAAGAAGESGGADAMETESQLIRL